MKKYIAKPVTIHAIQVTEQMVLYNEFPEDARAGVKTIKNGKLLDFKGYVETMEGTMEFRVGDWLIRGTMNELYPCKDEVFQKKYELFNHQSSSQMPFM